MTGSRLNWTAEELAWLRARKDMARKDLLAAFRLQFDRPGIGPFTLRDLLSRMGWKNEARTPANKGKKAPPDWKRSSTAFKKGYTPANCAAIGTERICFGHVEIKVLSETAKTGDGGKFVSKRVWLWEQSNGPLPKHHRLKCLDGNKLNCDPSNWAPVPIAILPRLSRRNYDQAPSELRPTILAIESVRHAARKAAEGNSADPASAGEPPQVSL